MKVKLIVGLGNPGKEYEKTYHNVGFLFIDYLAQSQISNLKSQKYTSKFKTFEYLKTNKIILIKPKTFMNESGKAVKEAIKYFKIKTEELLIVHDDSDIELGKYKISFGKGSAGHRGVQSIIDNLKTKNFWRLRLGIRKINQQHKTSDISQETKGEKRKARIKAADLVLKQISKEDLKILEKVFQKIDYDKN